MNQRIAQIVKVLSCRLLKEGLVERLRVMMAIREALEDSVLPLAEEASQQEPMLQKLARQMYRPMVLRLPKVFTPCAEVRIQKLKYCDAQHHWIYNPCVGDAEELDDVAQEQRALDLLGVQPCRRNDVPKKLRYHLA
eukprot:5728190-Pyramimonas_sp.AAC.1